MTVYPCTVILAGHVPIDVIVVWNSSTLFSRIDRLSGFQHRSLTTCGFFDLPFNLGNVTIMRKWQRSCHHCKLAVVAMENIVRLNDLHNI